MPQNSIERKLDKLIDEVSSFRYDTITRLVRLETRVNISDVAQVNQVSDHQFKWMRIGAIGSIAIGLGSLAARLIWR